MAKNLYKNSPKLEPEQEEEKPAAKEAEKTASKPPEAAAPKSTAELPTESGAIPIAEVHVRESKAMHTRHQQEYAQMVRRHAGELGHGEEGEKAEVSESKSGTEPK
jgi:hypothetical protein